MAMRSILPLRNFRFIDPGVFINKLGNLVKHIIEV